MVNETDLKISEEFAKKLLRALYKLDVPIGVLDVVLSKIDDEETKMVLFRAISEIMDITLSELMVPIYRCHPSLGRASEPGAWLNNNEGE